MAENKTQPNDQNVEEFLHRIDHAGKRADAFAVLAMMRELTGEEPQMWGDSMVGFGRYQYHYASGRSGEWFLVGFAPRKQNLTLYIMAGFEGYAPLMAQLGKHKTGSSCLYLNKLADVDTAVLRQLITESVAHMRAQHP